MPDTSDLMAFAALVLASVAIWAQFRVPKGQRVLDLLAESHRAIEPVANEVEATLLFEITGNLPDHWDRHPNDWEARVERRFMEARRIYRRVAAHLPPAGRQQLDGYLEDIAALREPGQGVRRYERLASFIDALERALDSAAHPS